MNEKQGDDAIITVYDYINVLFFFVITVEGDTTTNEKHLFTDEEILKTFLAIFPEELTDLKDMLILRNSESNIPYNWYEFNYKVNYDDFQVPNILMVGTFKFDKEIPYSQNTPKESISYESKKKFISDLNDYLKSNFDKEDSQITIKDNSGIPLYVKIKALLYI